MILKSDLFLFALLCLAPVGYCDLADPGQTGPGRLDLEFDPGVEVSGGIGTMQELPDGKVLVGGNISRIQGISRSRLARLNPDGNVDTSFVPKTGEFLVINSAMPSTNGSVVVMGNIIAANPNNGQQSKIVRLMTDGSVDAGFKPFFSPEGNPFAFIYAGPNSFVYVSSGLFRLASDGVWDRSYLISTDGLLSQMIGQADGKMLLVGSFSVIAGRDRNRLARLNADGSLDGTFVPEPIFDENSLGPERIAVQLDGKIIAVDSYSGGFGLPLHQPRTRLSRFDSDGSLDLSFFPEWDERLQVTAMKVQSTGAIVLATVPWNSLDPLPFSLMRLFPDGSLDYGFYRETKLNGPVTAVASLTENGLLIGGSFSKIAGSRRNGLARIYAGESSPAAAAIVRSPAGDHISEGADLILDPSIRAVPLASYQWQKNGVDLPGQTNRLLALRNVKIGDAGDYRIVAENRAGSAISSLATVLVDPMAPGSVDASFYNGSGPNGTVNQVVELPDGKLLIAGNFTTVDHKPRPRIARLNADGSLDEQFNPPVGPNNEISCLAVLDDGQILIAGPFDQIGATTRPFVAALKPDGTLNPTNRFAAEGRVNRIVFANDGRILACGDGFVRRWNPNFTPDSTFKTFNFDGVALALDFQSDGKIVVVGGLSGDGGTTRQNIARLDPNGSADKTFKVGSGANDRIDDLAIQPDGKILIAGAFTAFNGVPRGRIARLNIDGSVDTSFAVLTGATGGRIVRVGHFGLRDVTAIHSFLLQPDGHIVITGEFNAFENVPAGNIVRLLEDGTIDQNFIAGAGFPSSEGRLQDVYNGYNPFSSRWVVRIQPAANDAMFVMGNFPGMNRVARPGLVKLLGGEIAASAPVIKSKPEAFEARTGTNLLLYVQALGSPRASFQWLHDGQVIAGATGPLLALKNVRRLAAGEYSCLVSNSLGSVQFLAAKIGLIPPRREAGAVDPAFYANWDRTFHINSATVYADWDRTFQINSATIETDGRILLAGAIPGNSGTQPMALRLKPDGATETIFDFKGVKIQGGNISRAVSLPDGNVLINGSLDLILDNGNVRSVTWARIRPNGTLDPAYIPPTNTGYSSFLIKLSNGKILAGGDSTSGPRAYRLNADGTLDKSFAANVTFDGQPIQAAEDGQGRLLIGGDFSMIGNVRRSRIARLHPDGDVDGGFDPKSGPDGGVTGIGVQPDGGIIISGWFLAVGGRQKDHLARLHPDGSLDATFPKSDLGLYDGRVSGLVVVPDGRILLAGFFRLPPSQDQSTFEIVRLDSNGGIDPTLNIGSGFEYVSPAKGVGLSVTMFGATPTGKILVVGSFEKVDGLPRNGVVRLYSEAGPRLILQPDPSTQNAPSADDRRWRLLWDEGSLEEAANVSGPWRAAESAMNPLILLPNDARKFYRLRVDL